MECFSQYKNKTGKWITWHCPKVNTVHLPAARKLSHVKINKQHRCRFRWGEQDKPKSEIPVQSSIRANVNNASLSQNITCCFNSYLCVFAFFNRVFAGLETYIPGSGLSLYLKAVRRRTEQQFIRRGEVNMMCVNNK